MHALHTPSSIEPLESRIAPAIILVGAPDNIANDSNYRETGTPFVDTESAANAGDAITAQLGRVGVVDGFDTYYIKLSAGDEIRVYNNQSSFQPFIKVTSGNVVAFFMENGTPGSDGYNEVSVNEFVGLSLGKNASVVVNGAINGDVVTNLNEGGTVAKTDDRLDLNAGTGGLVSQTQAIKGLTANSVVGSIYSGGSVANVRLEQGVTQILAGTAANGANFDFYPGAVGGEGTLAVTAAAGIAGPSISKIRVQTLTNGIYAGDGGAGAIGGSISNIEVVSDTTGFTLQAGAGGAANQAVNKINGGAGGSISNVYIAGLVDGTPNSPAGIHLLAGAGGAGLSNGTGGAGGAATNLYVGFELSGTRPFASGQQLQDSLEIASGAGGSGKIGGAGGLVQNINVQISTPETNSPTDNELSVVAGIGGNSVTTGGRAGIGGSIKTVALQNQDDGQFADFLLQAGNAGTAVQGSAGAAGGSITTATILASEVTVNAGNGSSGTIGGAGGSITTVKFSSLDLTELNALTINAGSGGVGQTGAGGRGGSITSVGTTGSDLQFVAVNAGTAANGGQGNTAGGAGGAVTNFSIIDVDRGDGFNGGFDVRAGTGGLGKTAGGAGGNISALSLTATNLQPTITAGTGGAVNAGAGKGGAGGSILNADISADGTTGGPNGPSVGGTLTAGTGGAGLDIRNSGGAGGNVTGVNINVIADVAIAAGAGGTGQVTPGAGGSISTSAAFAAEGSGTMTAGSAGTGGTKAAKGGNIAGSAAQISGLRAALNLTVLAGTGSNGGAGGSISSFAFGSTSAADNQLPTPAGNILIRAGDGSASATVAGLGGSITNVDGVPSSGAGSTTQLIAGNGGGLAGSTRSGNGGSLTNVTITGGGEDTTLANTVTLTIEAGSAGVSSNASVGGTGGSVTNFSVALLDSSVTLQRVAAGDGSAGTSRGGLGGSIVGISAEDYDIGVRQGQNYGYTTMGGLFAGVGGTGTTAGLSGNVRNVTAFGIAAIVAGRAAAPQQVGTVEAIVTGSDPLEYQRGDLNFAENDADTKYTAYNATAYATNNLIGFVVDPTKVNGNKFNFIDGNGNGIYDLGETPIDGLIAAKVFKTAVTTLTPEASLIGTVFYDYDNK